ncbi:MAG: hypothetical protein KDH99_11610 [Alcanivoracaceae bacterium]|nr:hypothetical protein [Alcanivoracaceae bacterium]
MTRDRDIRLGEIDSVSVDEGRRQRPAGASQQPAAEQASATAARPAKRPAAPVRTMPVAASNAWLYVSAGLALMLLVIAVYFFREMQQMQARLDATLDQSSEQLGSLASQLSATDESLNQSSDQVRETLSLHDSEIRKLWDVSNKRNKDWIQANQAAISKLEKQRAETAKNITALQTEIAALKKQNQQIALQRNQMQVQLDLASESVRQAEASVASQKKIVDQVSQILPALKTMAAAQAKGEGLDTRLSEIEAAIAAFDVYRRQVNTRLDRIEGTPR